jgi:hypothetical protein
MALHLHFTPTATAACCTSCCYHACTRGVASKTAKNCFIASTFIFERTVDASPNGAIVLLYRTRHHMLACALFWRLWGRCMAWRSGLLVGYRTWFGEGGYKRFALDEGGRQVAG